MDNNKIPGFTLPGFFLDGKLNINDSFLRRSVLTVTLCCTLKMPC